MNVLRVTCNVLMKKGKKVKSEKILLKVLQELKLFFLAKNIKSSGVNYLIERLEWSSPLVNIVLKKIGGTVYKIPAPLKASRRIRVGILWLVEKKEISVVKGLLGELTKINKENVQLDAKRLQIHSMASQGRVHVRFLNEKLRV